MTDIEAFAGLCPPMQPLADMVRDGRGECHLVTPRKPAQPHHGGRVLLIVAGLYAPSAFPSIADVLATCDGCSVIEAPDPIPFEVASVVAGQGLSTAVVMCEPAVSGEWAALVKELGVDLLYGLRAEGGVQ